ncbi:DNA translocase FtsK-like [Homarus americanus]|uniref:DNA translocase FtsK-like n=1 Tax=Homarus americanus TaxID=6706 RepID=UPI001C43BC66|nr:DNA translocase FtsK-like [Homarus americanus]
MKHGKAVGSSGIVAEPLKAPGNVGVLIVTNGIMIECSTLDDWWKSVIMNTYKKAIFQSDNGCEFTSHAFSELKQMWPILLLVHGKPRHLQSQGSFERPDQPSQPLPDDKQPDQPSHPLPDDKQPGQPSHPLPDDKQPGQPSQPLPDDKQPDQPSQPLPDYKQPDQPSQPLPDDKQPDQPSQPLPDDKQPDQPSQL